ncbi:MAG: UDP-N-acetylmuramoyl-L-alanyl-D-glutamate--2,6-diaminopimelate ligase [Shewanella sp.]|nr:UDP-N-acetylmuramoyl-L-alanyl-D-glutamate--2,6-diaminopimelate ligase [Shewanella sp.]MCF1456760.1 UDP-N-acetylmuramoyl-L-alanyl-D-glutamate--2,6-diaminopimelate ligase [Shewanella sp.]
MMYLRDLLAPWMHYAGDEQFSDLTLDSRAIQPGAVFVALPGHAADGRQYIESAQAKGAVAALVHTDDAAQHAQVSREDGLKIYFHGLSHQVSVLAAQAWPLMPGRLKVIGITGTNGKTSVSQLIAQLLVLIGQRAAVMGTMGNGEWLDANPTSLLDAGNTTADPLTIMRQLKGFEREGLSACAMEVSSHGLVQGRVDAVPFEVAVFTNLTRDHLDYHGDMTSYGEAKKRLLNFASLRAALVNLDDATGLSWYQAFPGKYKGFSIHRHSDASYGVSKVQYHRAGVTATVHWPEGQAEIASPLLGEFNLSNLLAALSALHACGYDLQACCAEVVNLKPVAGRMECFAAAGKPTLVVDYAHTPDGLEQALKAARIHSRGMLWCLLGCGGDRDKGKRPMMAAVAEAFADEIVLTSDNARSEDPMAIIADMQAGLKQPQAAWVNPDRREAIKQVFCRARAGDIVLLAGKGHEAYQEIAGVKHDYDERALAALLAAQITGEVQ